MGRFTRVQLDDLSEVRRMPRLGKIRLGIKVRNRAGREYPKEVPYLVCPPEVLKKIGMENKPEDVMELDVMFASESQDENFPQRLAAYKASGLFCEGDGTTALRRNKGTWEKHPCPCPMLEDGDCKKMGTLNVILPHVSLGGVYQIVTSSWNSIVDLNSGIDHVRKMVGRVSWVPLKLRREPTQTSHFDKKTGKTHKQTHYTLKVIFPYDLDFVNRLKLETEKILAGPRYALPEPHDNPYDDPVDLIEEGEGGAKPTTARVVDTAPAPPPAEKSRPAATPSTPPPAAAPAPAEPPLPTPPAPEPAPAPEPPPTPAPPPGPQPPQTISEPQKIELWKAAQRALHCTKRDITRATAFFRFFVERYCGVASSSDIPVNVYRTHLEALNRLAAISDEATWREQLSRYEAKLKESTDVPL